MDQAGTRPVEDLREEERPRRGMATWKVLDGRERQRGGSSGRGKAGSTIEMISSGGP